MHYYSVKPISLVLRPSYLLLALLMTMGLLATGSICVLPIHILLKVLLCCVVLGCSGFYILKDALLRLPASWTALAINVAGECFVTNKAGATYLAEIDGRSFVTAHFSVITLQVKNKCVSLCLTPDRVDADMFRQLRVYLRWGKQAK